MATTIQTELGYLVPSAEKPIYIASEGGAEAQLDISAQFAPHAVTIYDARERRPAPTLDREGFTLVNHDTSVVDFYDDAQVRDVYESEAADLVQQATGASHVLVFDHTRRSDATAIRGARNTREPSAVIHNDYTDASAYQAMSLSLLKFVGQASLVVSFSLLGLQHPEPNGSRRATPTSTFQQRPGHPRLPAGARYLARRRS